MKEQYGVLLALLEWRLTFRVTSYRPFVSYIVTVGRSNDSNTTLNISVYVSRFRHIVLRPSTGNRLR